MKQVTCIFFGRSGSGKGTQASLLIEYLKKADPAHMTTYIETGDQLRNFMSTSPSYVATRVKEVLNGGGLLPAFMPIWIWTNLLIEHVHNNEHLILDGVARRGPEAPVLDNALQFLHRGKPAIIFLDVSNAEAQKRLLARGRHDDTEEKIAKRFQWFETDAMEPIRYFEKSPTCQFIKINGEQTIEEVHNDIVHALALKTK